MASLTPNEDAVRKIIAELKARPSSGDAKFEKVNELTIPLFAVVGLHFAKKMDEGEDLHDTVWRFGNALANTIYSVSNSVEFEEEKHKVAFCQYILQSTWDMLLRALSGDYGARVEYVSANVEGGDLPPGRA
jgi:hypothetical protein